MKNWIVLLLLFTCFQVSAQGGFSVSGTVSDNRNELLPGVTVFITNTKLASVTDGTGRFVIKNLPVGSYQVVMKMIGFVPYVQHIDVDKNIGINAKLQADNLILHDIIIRSKDPNRAEYLKTFIQNFIGQSTNASRCTIVNTGALRFSYDKKSGILSASADTMLVIENQGLGYRLNYLLTDFEYDQKNQQFLYAGYPYFEELKGNEIQQKDWQNNREAAYKGSINHFFKTVFNHSASKEGFYMFERSAKEPGKRQPAIHALNADSLITAIDSNLAMIKPEHILVNSTDTTELYVAYRGEKAPLDFTETSLYIKPPVKLSSANDQLSKMKPIINSIYINKDGVLIPDKSFLYSGFWAWEKIAEQMPLDYKPANSVSAPYDSKLIILESQ